ncbi:MAG: N-acetylmuramoyl-L-alanine amidase [Actinomycetota bacterium]|nr:N-acetylmuramoyl-L-alanine amidase [Actinomycetota bacterium]
MRDLSVLGGQGAASVERFDLVGFHWRGSGDVRFRTRGLNGHWSRWQTAAAEEDDQPDLGSREARSRGWRLGSPVWTGGSKALQYRVSGRVARLRAYLVRSSGASRPIRPSAAEEPEIITRPEWRADERIRRAAPWYAPAVRYAVVHHTAGSNSYSASQSAAIVRAIEVYHVRANGWNDIGYNFLVDRYGQVFEGRYGGTERAVVGAHAQGFNYGSVGVALIGSYGSTRITAAARRSLVSLLAWRLDLEHVDPVSTVTAVSSGNPRYPRGRTVRMRAVSGHRDAYPTDCPGGSLYAQLPAIAREVASTGLPKIYSPVVTGKLGETLRFRARISTAMPWTVTLTDPDGVVVATGSGSGSAIDWSWNASAAGGRYAYSIDAGPDARPVTGSLGGPVAQLRIDKLEISPRIVTPNGDRRGDTARVSYRLGAPATVTASLEDLAGNTIGVLFSGARKAGARSFVWKDVGLPDGRYRIVVSATGAGGKEVSTGRAFFVDRTLQGVTNALNAISPNRDGRFDATTISFQLNSAATVTVELRRAGKAVASIFGEALGPGSVKVPWNGTSGGKVVPDGRYDVFVRAVDAVTTVAQKVTVLVDTTAPKIRLVSRPKLLFRSSEPALIVARVSGRTITKHVGRGLFRLPGRGARHLSLVATDAVGNRSRLRA